MDSVGIDFCWSKLWVTVGTLATPLTVPSCAKGQLNIICKLSHSRTLRQVNWTNTTVLCKRAFHGASRIISASPKNSINVAEPSGFRRHADRLLLND